jgi:hypothetical protein
MQEEDLRYKLIYHFISNKKKKKLKRGTLTVLAANRIKKVL